MKRFLTILPIILFVILIQAPVIVAAGEKPLALQADISSGYYAIIIGINDYMAGSITDLQFCESDALDVKDTLVKYCGYNPENITLLTGTKANKGTICCTQKPTNTLE